MVQFPWGKMTKQDPHAAHKMKKKVTTGHHHQGTTPDKFGPTVMLMTTIFEGRKISDFRAALNMLIKFCFLPLWSKL